jgi:segregation and condensation protein A
MESFEVKVPYFEGPFDLLLFFIKRDELDIHDIPIAQITNDFLDYIHQLETMDLDANQSQNAHSQSRKRRRRE